MEELTPGGEIWLTEYRQQTTGKGISACPENGLLNCAKTFDPIFLQVYLQTILHYPLKKKLVSHCIWMTANTFGIHQCTVSKTVLEVCTAISTHLSPKYIHLPKTEDEMRAKVAEFEAQFGMVQALGVSTELIFLFEDQLLTPRTTLIINNFSPFLYKQCVILKATLWM